MAALTGKEATWRATPQLRRDRTTPRRDWTCGKRRGEQRRPILYHSRPGDLIYEPFSGSGTALIAAELTGRRCCAIELAPAFVDVAVLRWQRYTGKQATLEGDDRSFAEINAERRSKPDCQTLPDHARS